MNKKHRNSHTTCTTLSTIAMKNTMKFSMRAWLAQVRSAAVTCVVVKRDLHVVRTFAKETEIVRQFAQSLRAFHSLTHRYALLDEVNDHH